MDFEFTKEQKRFRREVQDFFLHEPQDDIVDTHTGVRYSPSYYRKLAQKGWLGLVFPKKYGGLELGNVYERILQEEMGRTAAPVGVIYSMTILEMGGILAGCGNEYIKQQYLRRVINAEIMEISQAFTEPEAGCDLATVQTRAVRQGDYYVVNGQKQFNSRVHADNGYLMLMARTNPDVPPEKGISLFIVDAKTPGMNISPIPTFAGFVTNQVYIDNMKVPKENLVGEENRGWDIFMKNRVSYWEKGRGLMLGIYQSVFENVVRYSKETKSNGRYLIEDPLVRQKLAEILIMLKAYRYLLYKTAWLLDKGLDAIPCAALSKAFSEDAAPKIINTEMQILGLPGQLQGDSDYAPLGGGMEALYRVEMLKHFVDAGGASMARNIIAAVGLGLPESYPMREL